MNTDLLPLVALHAEGATFAWDEGTPVTREAFLADVLALAARLPDAPYGLNLCDNRYLFMLGFAALVVRGQTNLLPPNRSEEVIREILADYPQSYVLYDQDEIFAGRTAVRVTAEAARNGAAQNAQNPQVPAALTAALVFTSGSTGRSRPNAKAWGSVVLSTQMARSRFLSALRCAANLVVTVPPQHMYGLETSVLMALQGGAAVHGGRPFFPQDVQLALASVPAPRVLVTTPVHLRACVKAGISFPDLAFIISATAPLPVDLAQAAEAAFNTEVREIYGCTETGSIASRRTVEGEAWTLYEGMTLDVSDNGAVVGGPQLPQPVLLQDIIEILPDGRFVLRGRNTDMINIAGKRASLGDLNYKLLQIPGVVDGVIFLPEHDSGPVDRLAALVVAPSLNREQLLTSLRACMDPVFLPRPLHLVDALPRNETSKLPRQALLAALKRETDRQ